MFQEVRKRASVRSYLLKHLRRVEQKLEAKVKPSPRSPRKESSSLGN